MDSNISDSLFEYENPVVSVVLPTYNRAYCIKRAISSVLGQTFDSWELIVVDNSSTDGTEEIVRGIDDLRIQYVTINNGGVIAKSRNKAIDLSRGMYVAFLDSDDWWLPEKLELSIELLSKGFDMVYHDLYRMKDYNQNFNNFYRIRSADIESPAMMNLWDYGNVIPTSSVVIRKSVLDHVGLFSESPKLIAVEDYDLWLRVSNYTDLFRRVDKTLGCYWLGDDSETTCERTMKSMATLVKRFEEISGIKNVVIPSWYDYVVLRCNLNDKKYKSSYGHLKNILFSDMSFIKKIELLIKIPFLFVLALGK